MKTNTKSIRQKKGVEKISMITAYDAMFARLADNAGVDIILVGDSLGNVVLGFDSTVNVTAEMMLHHVAAVARAKTNAMVVADIPFAQAHLDFDSLLKLCTKLVQVGADAVKIEGGENMAGKIAKLSDAGIAVMGHIGLQPQQVLKLGGYKKFGKTQSENDTILNDAKALQNAGVFSIVLEMCDANTTKSVSDEVQVPIIGIGAGANCDGQVLVCADLLGLTQNPPSFIKQYANLNDEIISAYKNFIEDVKNGNFPK